MAAMLLNPQWNKMANISQTIFSWCRQKTSHYPNQYWPSSMSSNSNTKCEMNKTATFIYKYVHVYIYICNDIQILAYISCIYDGSRVFYSAHFLIHLVVGDIVDYDSWCISFTESIRILKQSLLTIIIGVFITNESAKHSWSILQALI